MKKILALCLSLTLCVALLAACKQEPVPNPTPNEGDAITVKVAASPTPHAEILEIAKDILAEQNITLEIIPFTDYVVPNQATESGEVDANYFQHIAYLDQFNESEGTHLVNVAEIHYEPYGLYAGTTAALADLPDGAKIAVPNDPSNEGRALRLLEVQGLIKLNPDAGLKATKLDIAENPKNLDIVEMEAAQLPNVLDSVDMAVINGNYAIGAGLKVTEAVAVESVEDSEQAALYANVLVVKEGNEQNEGILALIAALQSDEVREYINATYGGAVVPVF